MKILLLAAAVIVIAVLSGRYARAPGHSNYLVFLQKMKENSPGRKRKERL